MYLSFLIVLVASALVFVVLRPLSSRVKFEAVFKVIAAAVTFLPMVAIAPVVVVAALLVYPVLGLLAFVFVFALGHTFLRAVGLATVVESLPIWSAIPSWSWVLLGAVVGGGGLFWLEHRPFTVPASQKEEPKS